MHTYDLPPTTIEVAPDYREYKCILADDDTILVIDPETWEIVNSSTSETVEAPSRRPFHICN
jgi:hypothetical protein